MSRLVIEHKQLLERPVDALWNATWKWTVLILYFLVVGAVVAAVFSWLWR